MKRFSLILFLAANCFALDYEYLTLTNGHIYYPYNFFAGHSNEINAVVSGTASCPTNFDYTAITNAPWLTNVQAAMYLSNSVLADGIILFYDSINSNSITYGNDTAQAFVFSEGIVAPLFDGDGSQLTNLNANSIALGTLANDRLPSNVITQGHSVAVTVSNSVSINGTNYIYRASPPANELLFTIATSADANRFSVDEDGDVVADGAITANAGGDWSLGINSTFARLKNLYIEPSGSHTSSRYWFKSDANADLATIRSSNAVFSGTLTATNGVYYHIAQTNSGLYTNILQPTHSFASMMMYTTNTINGGAGVYATITNYTVGRSNLMYCDLAGGIITNTIAGFYKVGIHLSGIALDNSATVEGDLLLNGIEQDDVSFLTEFDNPPRIKGMSAIGILYITNNTPITFQVKSSGASGITIQRAQITIGAP